MTDETAECLRSDPAQWRWGLIDYCPQDPGVMVRNRAVLGGG